MVRALLSVGVAAAVFLLPVLGLAWYLEYGANNSPLYAFAARLWNMPAGLGTLGGLAVTAVAILQAAHRTRNLTRDRDEKILRGVAGTLLGEVTAIHATSRARYLRLLEMAGSVAPTERLRIPGVPLQQVFRADPRNLTFLPAPVAEDVTALYGRLTELNIMVSGLISPNRLKPGGDLLAIYFEVVTIAERLMMSLANVANMALPDIRPLPGPDQAGAKGDPPSSQNSAS